mgnify:CR=1 FL=1
MISEYKGKDAMWEEIVKAKRLALTPSLQHTVRFRLYSIEGPNRAHVDYRSEKDSKFGLTRMIWPDMRVFGVNIILLIPKVC